MTVSRRQQGASAGRWGRLLTESRNPRSRRLDTLSTSQVVDLLLDEDRRALIAARRQRAPIVRAADAFVALKELGFKETAARRGVDAAIAHVGAGASLEELIRAALLEARRDLVGGAAAA